MQTRLEKSKTDKMIGGVCGGLAAYLNVDSVLVRFAFLMLLFASGIGLPLYIILLILMPEENSAAPDSEIEEDIKVYDEDVNTIKNKTQAANGRSHPQGPIIFAAIMIAIGLYLLGQNAGLLGWLNISWFGPLIIIGIGLYVIYRSRNSRS